MLYYFKFFVLRFIILSSINLILHLYLNFENSFSNITDFLSFLNLTHYDLRFVLELLFDVFFHLKLILSYLFYFRIFYLLLLFYNHFNFLIWLSLSFIWFQYFGFTVKINFDFLMLHRYNHFSQFVFLFFYFKNSQFCDYFLLHFHSLNYNNFFLNYLMRFSLNWENYHFM